MLLEATQVALSSEQNAGNVACFHRAFSRIVDVSMAEHRPEPKKLDRR
jgi:hypothetical protein